MPSSFTRSQAPSEVDNPTQIPLSARPAVSFIERDLSKVFGVVEKGGRLYLTDPDARKLTAGFEKLEAFVWKQADKESIVLLGEAEFEHYLLEVNPQPFALNIRKMPRVHDLKFDSEAGAFVAQSGAMQWLIHPVTGAKLHSGQAHRIQRRVDLDNASVGLRANVGATEWDLQLRQQGQAYAGRLYPAPLPLLAIMPASLNTPIVSKEIEGRSIEELDLRFAGQAREKLLPIMRASAKREPIFREREQTARRQSTEAADLAYKCKLGLTRIDRLRFRRWLPGSSPRIDLLKQLCKKQAEAEAAHRQADRKFSKVWRFPHKVMSRYLSSGEENREIARLHELAAKNRRLCAECAQVCVSLKHSIRPSNLQPMDEQDLRGQLLTLADSGTYFFALSLQGQRRLGLSPLSRLFPELQPPPGWARSFIDLAENLARSADALSIDNVRAALEGLSRAFEEFASSWNGVHQRAEKSLAFRRKQLGDLYMLGINRLKESQLDPLELTFYRKQQF